MTKQHFSLKVPAFLAAVAMGGLIAACGSPKTPGAGQPKPPVVAAARIGVIPAPRDISITEGSLRIAGGTNIQYSGGEGAKQTAAVLRRA